MSYLSTIISKIQKIDCKLREERDLISLRLMSQVPNMCLAHSRYVLFNDARSIVTTSLLLEDTVIHNFISVIEIISFF